jgi:hypothetical protein
MEALVNGKVAPELERFAARMVAEAMMGNGGDYDAAVVAVTNRINTDPRLLVLHNAIVDECFLEEMARLGFEQDPYDLDHWRKPSQPH